ncbi:putative capsular polysaccharide biosynthesis protein [Janthinobacterium sp. HH01]|uniref:glycosyltransferase n=1 Tax=Janthinobacterium sp. HH01 TaxID=1198452 RepID=UPI0002AEAA65|nr:glycosyltransferase [Janthinobacterium sp. HH01]ELX08753.1 putative capsular polysaccharide biosynthesis protein [Janthinobacterium sp. HH01]
MNAPAGRDAGATPDGIAGLRIALVGPLPPPAGGMANQTAQLASLLRDAGAMVDVVQVNPPWRPAWAASVRGLRAALRLPPYVWRLWRAAGKAQLFHVMANSGWAWHLHAAPAIWIARLRGKGVLLNYRGGEAEVFLARRAALVRFTMRRAHQVVVPSTFLAEVFARHGVRAQIVPNIVDLALFQPSDCAAPHASILIARHLEPLYDHATALRAFALVRRSLPHAHLTICGQGPELQRLQQLAQTLDVSDAVHFAGKLDNASMAAQYRLCDLALNPSLADNQPISILEAWASGVPVVSTGVGGVPHLVRDQINALLVPPQDPAAMARAMLSVLQHPSCAWSLASAGRQAARRYAWPQVAPLLMSQYRLVLKRPPAVGYTALVSTLLFPVHEMLKRHRSVCLRWNMERSQWWSPQQLEALQLQRLRELLLHASEHVPYFRQLYTRLNFDANRVHDLRDLRCLPILNKADINRHRDDFVAEDAGPLQRFNTGGSSGEPLIFFQGKDRVSHDVAAKWRATRWWGVDIGDREALMWGSPIELNAQDRWRMRRDRLLRSVLLPAFDLSAARLDDYLGRLQRLRPAMLFGYPSAMCVLVKHAQSRRIALNGLGVKVVFVTAERLYDEQRALLEQAFAAPVANGYGGRDAGFLAHECPEGGMHITAEDVIIEIVDAQGAPVAPGDSGAIVVTHLASRDFPFIRYATGDVGALDTLPCPCGRGLPLLKRVEGRVTDFIVARDGTVMHGLALIYVLRDLPEVRAFKIIQESLDTTRVLLVSVSGLPPALRLSIVSQFRARLGASVEILIDEVEAIPAEASGKHRYVISKVSSH